MQLVLNFWRSQLGKKVVMAVTGLIGVGFVIGHMVGNLQAFQGPEKINAYGRFLHETMGDEFTAKQDLFERVQAGDTEVVQEPTDQPYGVRDCAVRDPAGNLIRIQQR